MKNTSALKKQNFRILAAYQRMNSKGRAALDKIVGQLAKLHDENNILFFNHETNREQSRKEG
jgi:hypothetical protein